MKIHDHTKNSFLTTDGFFRMAEDAYHDDPCPDASLNQTTAKVILQSSLKHAWEQHPRLNPDFERKNSEAFDRGRTAHTLLLGKGAEIVVVEADDWRTKVAKDVREAARALNRIPMLRHQMQDAANMHDALMDFLADAGFPHVYGEEGESELVAIALAEGSMWLRTMIDWAHNASYYDYKTTERRLSSENLPNIIYSDGWHIQAAFQEKILDMIDPEHAGKRVFRFVAQENYPPFAATIVEMTKPWMTMGRKECARAFDQWSTAMRTGKWPAYSTLVQRPDLPGWLESRMLEREITADERRKASTLDSLAGG